MLGGNSTVMRKAMLDALSLPAFILFFTMMGFGSLARGAGFGADMAVVASLLIWGLPGQLAMVELTSTGQSIAAIMFACSLANARFLPMVVSFVPAMVRGHANLPRRLLDAQLLSINSWAVCMREFPNIEPEFRHRYYVTFASSLCAGAVRRARPRRAILHDIRVRDRNHCEQSFPLIRSADYRCGWR
jgi:predicted branched-subunit amino acid permease